MDRIEIIDNHKLMDTEGMFYKEFPSDYRQIRYFTLLIVQKAPPEIREINLLEQQISELIKNAVKHGNESNPDKLVKVWYTFSEEHARIIIKDEGEGFIGIKEWND
jgi:anti-sigma regulatory factor (Ser/Thr protein kinase)